MKTANKNLQNSLQCFQHPATWLSITLLLINDHVLKIVSPTWVTGKLSDFAGLFFFPFIIAAGISTVISETKISSKNLGVIAFGLTLVWFVLLKTTFSINSLTTQLASLLVGAPVQLVLDPTDIIATLVMVPSWLIWTNPSPTKLTRFAYLSLVIGSMAAMATSPREWTVYKVTNLEYYKDGIVYAADTDGWGDYAFPVAKSLDGGETWESANEINNIERKSLPITHCSQVDFELCYRVTKAGILQELSEDGAWVDLQGIIPGGRVNDLILFEWDEKEFVIVAIGEYGILRRELPDGDWAKINVLRAVK